MTDFHTTRHYQMVSDTSLVNRSANTTSQHVGTWIDDEVAILECMDAVVSIQGKEVTNRDIYKANTQVREVFRHGYREELLKLPDSFKRYMIENYVDPSNIDLGFGLLRLKPDVLPISFRCLKQDPFKKFEMEFSTNFAQHFIDLGSVEFLKKMHSYYVTHGESRDWDADSESYIPFHGRFDRYMAYTILVLKDAYGEQKVMDFLDRLITEIPAHDVVSGSIEDTVDPLTVRAVDALRIVQSDVDFSETPLHWAIQIAAER